MGMMGGFGDDGGSPRHGLYGFLSDPRSEKTLSDAEEIRFCFTCMHGTSCILSMLATKISREEEIERARFCRCTLCLIQKKSNAS